jgi:hypothetical protein
MGEFDARALNWRFLVPDEPEGLLLLRVADEELSGAVTPERTSSHLAAVLRAGSYPAVVAPDLGSWASLDGVGGSGRLLSSLASSVSPRGWLTIGLANPWYPIHPFERGALGPRKAARILRSEGFGSISSYLAFPDQRCPAYLLGSDGHAELDYLLDRLFLPYVGNARGLGARLKRRVIGVFRRAALLTPHRIRAALAPAALLVARRDP